MGIARLLVVSVELVYAFFSEALKKRGILK
jgi:hypothetical protein